MKGKIFSQHLFERRRTEKTPETGSIVNEPFKFHNIIGKSDSMKRVYSFIKKLADIHSTVLIKGESGTGKELVAEAIHHEGHRRNRPFIKINCSSISENLLENDFFTYNGFNYGRKIFQVARGGTIFLDKIGELSKNMQIKLLSLFQHNDYRWINFHTSPGVDVRIIGATNQDLLKMVKRGNFREDLYYRLEVIDLVLPPLRERKEDIPVLTEYFIEKLNKKFNRRISSLSDDVTYIFMNYFWPGNVRELKHTLEYAFTVCNKTVISRSELPSNLNKFCSTNTPGKRKKNIDEEKEILKALEQSRWKKKLAAQMLGISRQCLYNKLKKYKIEY